MQFGARQLQSILHQLFYSVLPTSDTVTQGAIEHQQVGALPLLMLCGGAMAPHCKQCLYTCTDTASETGSRMRPELQHCCCNMQRTLQAHLTDILTMWQQLSHTGL